ncbi:MAG: ABC transporter substrate-binding protein [Anaerolineae bacterium]|nr:ABC transporter substrate-binding protein [Anaerolineae bacterium]
MSANKHFRYSLCVWFVVAALLLSGCGAKQPEVYRVGILCGLGYMSSLADGFKAKMVELGYVEGENITYDYQQVAILDAAEYERIIQKFVDDKVDLIFVFPHAAAATAKKIADGSGIPIVFAFSYVEKTGLINSVREPGGNLTGVRYPGPDIALRRFEIMQQLAPDAKHVLIPYQRGLPIIQPQLDVLAPVAEAAGVTLIEFPADNAAELETSLQALATSDGSPVDAVMLLPEALSLNPDAFRALGKFAYGRQIPIGGASMEVDEYSSIYGVTVDTYETGELAAPLVDRILKGGDPSTMPVVSPEMFFQINYATAQKLGVEVSESLLNQADEVLR